MYSTIGEASRHLENVRHHYPPIQGSEDIEFKIPSKLVKEVYSTSLLVNDLIEKQRENEYKIKALMGKLEILGKAEEMEEKEESTLNSS